jgi:tetratricopeptide (TPR) repeat protein
MDQDYERALEQFDIATRLSPSDGDIVRLIAAIERRQGKWKQALEEYERVAKLDPQNPNTVRELIFTNTAMRRWPEPAAARTGRPTRAWQARQAGKEPSTVRKDCSLVVSYKLDRAQHIRNYLSAATAMAGRVIGTWYDP